MPKQWLAPLGQGTAQRGDGAPTQQALSAVAWQACHGPVAGWLQGVVQQCVAANAV